MDARKRLALSRELELGDKTIACAGFDVGKKFVDIHSAGEDGSFENDHSGHRAIAGFPRKHSASSVVIEATGRLHRGLRRSLDDRGFEVCVAYTRQARDFAGAAGRMATTDRVEGRIVKHVESDPEQLRLPHSFVDSGQRADRGRRAPRLDARAGVDRQPPGGVAARRRARRPLRLHYMAAMSAMWHNADMAALYDRLVDRGNKHVVAIVAVIRKLAVLANVLRGDGREWEECRPASS